MCENFHYVHITTVNMALLDNIAIDVFDEKISEPLLSNYLDASGHGLFIALAGNLVVGHARGVVHHQPDARSELFIDNLGVSPAYQRKGIAKTLVKKICDWAKEEGCEGVWVAAEIPNQQAADFYMSIGMDADGGGRVFSKDLYRLEL